MTEYRVYILYRIEGVTKSTVLVTDNDNKLVFPIFNIEYRVTKPFSAGDLEEIRDTLTNGEAADLNEDEFYKPETRIEVKEDSPKSVPMGISPQIKIKEVTTINEDQLNLLREGYAQAQHDYEERLGQIDARYETEINDAEDALKKLKKSLRRERDQLLTPGQSLEGIIKKLQ